MRNSIEIKAEHSLVQIENTLLDTIPPGSIDYIYSENYEKSGRRKHFLYIKSKEELPGEAVSNCLADWILSNYESKMLSEILLEEFDGFSECERSQILEIAECKAELYNNIYNYRYIVKKISDYLEKQNNISIDGFLKFRLAEYRCELEMLLNESIEEFYAEQEYREFINLITDYINMGKPLIDLIHVKANFDKSFSFYDFKKNEIVLEINDRDLFEELFTEEDKVMSVLISIMPKRIIWHNETENTNYNLINTIKEIFNERFTVCTGCELCKQL